MPTSHTSDFIQTHATTSSEILNLLENCWGKDYPLRVVNLKLYL